MKCRVSVKYKSQTHFEDHQKNTLYKINQPCNIFRTSSVGTFWNDSALIFATSLSLSWNIVELTEMTSVHF